MNDLEVRAYGLVAQAIAQHAFASAETEQKLRPSQFSRFPEAVLPIYCHYSDSTFEAVAHDLWRLGILRPLDQKGGWAFHFVFDCETTKSNIVAEQNWREGPTLFDLLKTFINLFGDYGAEYWRFSTKPGVPFGIDSQIAPTLEALAATGYLVKTNGGYVWTELIAPVMRASYEFEYWADAIASKS
jgi:hypothetical protein